MHLKLRHLEVFHAVMEEGSVTKAAERLNLSQPAISTALTKLEEMLGFALFYRSKGHFTPRPEAFLLNEDAELSLMAVEQFANRARLIGRGGVGLVRIGAIGAPAFALLPELISAFVTDHPLVEVDLQVRSSTQISYLVANGQLDIGLIEAPVAAASIVATEIVLPCVCIMREDSDLAFKHAVTPQDLVGQRLIGIQNVNQVDRQLREVCSAAGVEIETTVRGFFFAVVRRMISAGGGVALVDALNGMQTLSDGVVWRSFEPRIDYRIAMITKVGAELSKPAKDFSGRLLETLARFGRV
jgi:DNA-binding transcriptional LysR family regulator